eukprot:gene2050-3034_t
MESRPPTWLPWVGLAPGPCLRPRCDIGDHANREGTASRAPSREPLRLPRASRTPDAPFNHVREISRGPARGACPGPPQFRILADACAAPRPLRQESLWKFLAAVVVFCIFTILWNPASNPSVPIHVRLAPPTGSVDHSPPAAVVPRTEGAVAGPPADPPPAQRPPHAASGSTSGTGGAEAGWRQCRASPLLVDALAKYLDGPKVAARAGADAANASHRQHENAPVHLAPSAACQTGLVPHPHIHLRPHQSGILAWRCPGSAHCGGTGDRFKGMMSAFLVALLQGKEFRIHAKFLKLQTCMLIDSATRLQQEFIVPASSSVPWDTPVNEGWERKKIKDKAPGKDTDVLSALPMEGILSTNLDLTAYISSLPAWSGKLDSIGLLVLPTHSATPAPSSLPPFYPNSDMSDFFECFWAVLFRPTALLEGLMQDYLQAHPRFLGIQVRTGNGTSWSGDGSRTYPVVVDRMWDQ